MISLLLRSDESTSFYCVVMAFQISEIEQPCAQMSWMVEMSWGFSVKSLRKMVRDTGFEPVTPTV